MSARRLDGISDAKCPGSSHTDDIAFNARLRNQVLPHYVNVARPHLALLGHPLARRLVVGRAAAFAKPVIGISSWREVLFQGSVRE